VLNIRPVVSGRRYDQHPLLLGVVKDFVDGTNKAAASCLGEGASQAHVRHIGVLIGGEQYSAQDLTEISLPIAAKNLDANQRCP